MSLDQLLQFTVQMEIAHPLIIKMFLTSSSLLRKGWKSLEIADVC